jgi:RNA polymerase sigma-70 factor (ECF subfamily)
VSPEELFARYAQRLTLLAQRQLSGQMAGRIDGEDVVQSVFRTVCRRWDQGEFRIDSSDQWWRLLVQITVRKARAKGRFHTAARRDPRSEAPGEDLLAEALAREPGPEEAAALLDQVETLLHGLDPVCRQILDMRLAGYQVAEIMSALDLSRRTVYHVLDLLQSRLLRDSAGAM